MLCWFCGGENASGLLFFSPTTPSAHVQLREDPGFSFLCDVARGSWSTLFLGMAGCMARLAPLFCLPWVATLGQVAANRFEFAPGV